MSQLIHSDSAGQAYMIDVGGKAVTHRMAVTTGTIHMLPETFVLVHDGNAKKGDVLGIAYAATIQGSKRTSDLTPLCYPLALTKVAVESFLDEVSHVVRRTVRVGARGQTGVGMETLTAVQMGLLTIYDMCEAVDWGMVIGDVQLLEKHRGRSGDWVTD